MVKSADPDQLASSDLDLHCLQRQGISGFSWTSVKVCGVVSASDLRSQGSRFKSLLEK